MGSLTRHDFFRVLVPGAAALFFLDVALRIIGSAQGVPSAPFTAARVGIEQPFTAFTIAFALGLLLYFVDLGYGAPQYYASIPSTHLEKELRKRNCKDADWVSLYLVVGDSMLPPQLQDRALFYGAVYRIGFQVIFFAFLTVAAVPVVILHLRSNTASLDITFRTETAAAAAVVVFTALLPRLGRCVWIKQQKQRRPSEEKTLAKKVRFVMGVVTLLSLPTAAWLYAGFAEEETWAQPVIEITTAVAIVGWGILRLGGPLKARWEYMRGARRTKPDVPHRPSEVALLDLVVAVPSIVGMVTLGPSLRLGSIWALALLTATALLLAFFRKHERQQWGIYRNQSLWIDANIDDIIEKFKLSPDIPSSPPGRRRRAPWAAFVVPAAAIGGYAACRRRQHRAAARPRRGHTS